jgi:hypothetical protein
MGFCLSAFVVLLSSPALSQTKGIDPQDILEKTIEREFQDMEMSVHLVKVSKKGRERPMDLAVKMKKTPEASKTFAVFTGPPEVEGISSLSWDYEDPEKPADRWFRLSGMEYVKCLGKACRNMEERFGFSAEIFEVNLDDAEHKLLTEEEIDGAACYKIESRAKDPDRREESMIVTWVDKEKLAARRIETYDKNGNFLTTSVFTELKMLGDHWWETSGEYTMHKSGKRVRFQIKDARINTGIPDQVFEKPKLFSVEEDEKK